MNPALPDLIEALTHLKFAHGLNDNSLTNDTIADLCSKVAALVDREQRNRDVTDLPEIP